MPADHEWLAANFDEELRVAQSVHLSTAPDEEAGSVNRVLVAVLNVQVRIIGLLSCFPEEGPADDAQRASRNDLLKTYDALLADVKTREDLTEARDRAMIESTLRMVHETLDWIAALPVTERVEADA